MTKKNKFNFKTIKEKAKKSLEKSYLNKTWKEYLQNKKKVLIIFFIDILFLISMWGLVNLIQTVIPKSPSLIQSIVSSTYNLFIFIIGFIGIYFLLLILVYSIFKYIILHYLKIIEKKEKFSKKSFINFFLMNILNFLIFGILFFILNYIYAYVIKAESLRFFMSITLIPFLTLTYTYFNIAHTLFEHENKVRKTIKDSFNILFNQAKKYIGIILSTISFWLILSIVYSLISTIAISLFSNPQTKVIIFIMSQKILLYGLLIAGYFTISFNRFYFQKCINKNK